MRPFRFLAGLSLVLALVCPAWAWNFSGHWVAAAIAYQRLSPSVKAKVDDLIRQHPDYEKFNFADAPQTRRVAPEPPLYVPPVGPTKFATTRDFTMTRGRTPSRRLCCLVSRT